MLYNKFSSVAITITVQWQFVTVHNLAIKFLVCTLINMPKDNGKTETDKIFNIILLEMSIQSKNSINSPENQIK